MSDLDDSRPYDPCPLRVPVGEDALDADLAVPPAALGLVLFAHGSGSSRFSPRNRLVAQRLHRGGFATVLADLLTPQEERIDERTRALRFDLPLLADRLGALIAALQVLPETAELRIGLFGASTGAGAALMAAARRPQAVFAVVSRGGRPDLAGEELAAVQAPTLLIVGGADPQVITLNEQALARLHCERRIVIVPEAGHLFEEPGTLETVATLALEWFQLQVRAAPPSS
jgi:pimeloyl-ACP methyl ester carboxylesterase